MLTAGAVDRLLGGWGVPAQDPNDHYGQDGQIVSNRGQWSYDNDGITHAIVETILSGTLGPTGLQYRSAYQRDDIASLTDQEKKVRASVQRGIERGTADTSFDAGGLLTRGNMSKVVLASTIMHGIGLSVFCWKPNRPGRHTHATCWRIPNALRLSNPKYTYNTDRLRDGFALDDDGVPIGIHLQRSHPASQQVSPKQTWDYFPLFGPDGYRRVTIHSLPRHADQIRPTGWFTPVMQIMRLLSRTIEAKVVADTLKASMGLIWESDDPEAAAAADRNGAVLSSTTKIVPGKCYYVKRGDKATALNFNYQGQDFDKWVEVILTNICASFGLPYQFVQHSLTDSNMAAARVALLQAYRTFHSHQNDLIISTEEPWNQSLIREDLARDRIDGIDINDPEQVERLLIGTYLRPPRFMPDPLKEQQAADVATKRNGVSFSTVYAEMGMDFREEAAQREQDDAELKRRGIVLQGDGSVMAPAPNQTPPKQQPEDPEDGKDGTEDPPPSPDEETQAAQLADAMALARAAIDRPSPPITVNLTVPARGPVKVQFDEHGRVTGTAPEGV
jgi:capsid protein